MISESYKEQFHVDKKEDRARENPFATPKADIDPEKDPLKEDEVQEIINSIAEDIINYLRRHGWTKEKYEKYVAEARSKNIRRNIAEAKSGSKEETIFKGFIPKGVFDIIFEAIAPEFIIKESVERRLDVIFNRSPYNLHSVVERIEAAILMKMDRLDENFR